MKCLIWYREKKNKDPKLCLFVKGSKGALRSILENLTYAAEDIKS